MVAGNVALVAVGVLIIISAKSLVVEQIVDSCWFDFVWCARPDSYSHVGVGEE